MSTRPRTIIAVLFVPLLCAPGGCVQAEKSRYDAILQARVQPGSDEQAVVTSAFGIDESGRSLNDVLVRHHDPLP